MMETLLLGTALANEPLSYRQDWVVVTDRVMGGVSTAKAETLDKGALKFTGELSLENNGGFTSTRVLIDALNPGKVKSLEFKVLGDGREYSLTMRSTRYGRQGLNYQQTFQTEKGKTTTVELEMEKFFPKAYGRSLPQYPPLYLQNIPVDVVGLLLADKNPGSFEIEIETIHVRFYEEKTTDSILPQQAPDIFMDAISKGVPMYNRGNVKGCAELYENAISTVLQDWKESLAEEKSRKLQQTLNASKIAKSDSQKAWILRHGMDEMLSNIQQ